MSKKFKVYSVIILLLISGFIFYKYCFEGSKFFCVVRADDVTSSVTVGNTAPVFTVVPAEGPSSTQANPTNVGVRIDFTATATDSNGNQYYLAICKASGISAGVDGPPTCTDGEIAMSSATNSGSQAIASYTTQQADNESYVWYGYVCDKVASGAACSTVSQGSGDSGSPFYVNHAPSFTYVGAFLGVGFDPGDTVTWTTTSSDSDVDGTADTVKLVVCKTAGISGTGCDGGGSDTWCSSSLTASDPSCSYVVPIPTHDDSFAAYTYVFDSHNFASSGPKQATDNAYQVANVAPVVSGVTVNGGSDITLNEGTTKNVIITGTVTDNNSCQDISTVEASAYRSSIAYANCDQIAERNTNNCYAQVSCTVDVSNTCTGATDTNATYTCTMVLQYNTDPTDADTPYSADGWIGTVKGIDDDTSSHNANVASQIEVLSLVGYDVTTSINYGLLNIGDKNDPLDKITTITATGNVGLDEELSGAAMSNGSDGTIAVNYQKYALASSTAYSAATSLSGVVTEAELNCLKTTNPAAPQTKNTWWGLQIPVGTPAGSYTGTNTIVAVKGEVINWE